LIPNFLSSHQLLKTHWRRREKRSIERYGSSLLNFFSSYVRREDIRNQLKTMWKSLCHYQ
jgi:hypothetical protein